MRLQFTLSNGMKVSVPVKTQTPFQEWAFAELQTSVYWKVSKTEGYSK